MKIDKNYSSIGFGTKKFISLKQYSKRTNKNISSIKLTSKSTNIINRNMRKISERIKYTQAIARNKADAILINR